MYKGKPKKSEKKHLSIVFVPHSTGRVRVLKFTSFYGKLLTAALLTIGLASATAVYVSRITAENRGLKGNLSELYDTNSDQRKLLEEKSREISQMIKDQDDFNGQVNEDINDFTKKFNELTDKYISGQSGTKASRSGDRNEKSFASDIGQLKGILDDLSGLYNRIGKTSDTLTAAEEKLEKYMDTVPTLWPVQGRINDGFGNRRDPITRGREFHEGQDIAVPYGTSVKAAASGTVVLASYHGGYGRAVIIDHGHGLSTLYGHNSKLLVKVGQTVKKGDIIAKSGSSGRSTGPHVHFEVLLYDTPVDPLQYLDDTENNN